VPNGKRDHHVLRTRTRKASDSRVSRQSRVSDAMTAFSGSMPFVYFHAIWFGIWLLCNEGVFGKSLIFDPFPFGLLTLIVSLEAIFFLVLGSGQTWPTAVHRRRPQLLELRARRRPGQLLRRGASTDTRDVGHSERLSGAGVDQLIDAVTQGERHADDQHAEGRDQRVNVRPRRP